ncbi:MAG: ABC transporter permease [Anaerolineae bacterium]|nr:ABC transporter permease [Anaerolineae bacterium]
MTLPKSNRTLRILLPYLTLVFVLALWQLVASLGWFLPALFPSPVDVWHATVEMWQSGSLFKHVSASLMRVFLGYLLSVLVAVPFGFILGQYRLLHDALTPLVQILRPISPIAWIPLAILWFGIGNKPAIFIIFITVFFPTLLTSAAAVRNIDPLIIKSAVNLGARNRDILVKVVLPATFPSIVIGLRVTLGIAWMIIVAAEMVGMQSGLGFMILDARNFLRIDRVVSGMVIVGLIGFILDRGMVFVENVIRVKWGYQSSF